MIALVFVCFSGSAFTAAADSLDRAMSTAKPELYGMYTLQSANALRDRYDRAAAVKAAGGTDNAVAVMLRNSLNGLVPLDNYTRVALGGFDAVTNADISAMRLCSGSVSVSGGVMTLSGEGALRYCNAVPGGIAGASPFGAGIGGCDGFALKIAASAKAALDIEIGARGDSSSVFTVSDVAVSQGERYYFFPFGSFGCQPDETLNYISLTFTGADEISVGDMHGVAGALDGVASGAGEEVSVTPQNLNGRPFCRILQKGTDLALTMLSPNQTGDACCVFRQSDPEDDAQLWLLCGTSASLRIINKHFAFALRVENALNPIISAARANLTSSDQIWSYSFNKNRGYTFTGSGSARLSYYNNSVRLAQPGSSAKYFDIVSAGAEEWTTTWSDEFDGSSIDRTVWNVRDGVVSGGENAYAFRDSEENVYVENGNLVIHTFEGEYRGRPATSGHVSTEDNMQFGYGRYEFRVKMPEGQGVFPALWMMGNDDLWPRDGEIDVLEMVGTGEADGWRGEKKPIATFHYTGDAGEHVEAGGYTDEGWIITNERISLDYHIYAIEWEKDQLRWYFDDILYLTVNTDTDALKNALQENPMYLRMNVALHGPGNYQLPENMTESFMYVDYVRYMKPRTAAKPQSGIVFDRTLSTADYNRELWYPANAGATPAAQDKLIYATGAGEAKLFDVNNMTELGEIRFNGEDDWVKCTAFSADGRRIAFGCVGGIIVCRSSLGSYYRADFASDTPVVALNCDGSRCYFGGQPNDASDACKYFYVYNTSAMTLVKKEYTGSWVDSIAVFDGGVYAYGCYNGLVRVRSASDADLGEFEVRGRALSLAFSPDGNRLYVACSDCNIYAYDIETGVSSLFAPCGDEFYRITLSPDGTRLAAACGDSCARVYDTESRRLVARPCLGRLFVTAVSYSVDGRLLLLGCTDGRIGVFRADDGHPLALLTENGLPRWFDTLALSSDNSVLMSIRRVYDFQSGPIAWKLPSNLIPADGGDASALAALAYYDETAYTPESYTPYAAALKNAQAVKANRYSAQSVINEAAQAVSAAAEALVEIPAYSPGDVDGDREVTVSDALLALRIAAQLRDADASALAAGDLDGDGEVTVTDAVGILRIALGSATR